MADTPAVKKDGFWKKLGKGLGKVGLGVLEGFLQSKNMGGSGR